jgi:hypothetical protein
MKKVGGNGSPDANALWRGRTWPRGRAFPRQSNNPPTPSSFAKATEDKWLRRGKDKENTQ